MGCMSSKIITKSASFRDEWNRLSFQRKGKGLDEIIISKNGGNQFVALSTADTVARRLKEETSKQNPNESQEPSLEYGNSNTVIAEGTVRKSNAIETINTWELLAGLEEGNGTEEHSSNKGATLAATSDKSVILGDSISLSRSFRTVDDVECKVEKLALECVSINGPGNAESSGKSAPVEANSNDCNVKKLEPEHESINGQVNAKEGGKLKGNLTTEKGSRRKSMAKDLAVLNVPVFEFPKAAGRLKEWILIGGEVFSLGTYDTPKFGNFVSRRAEHGDNVDVFHPELVAQFEQDMEQLTMEEDCIIERLEVINEGNT